MKSLKRNHYNCDNSVIKGFISTSVTIFHSRSKKRRWLLLF